MTEALAALLLVLVLMSGEARGGGAYFGNCELPSDPETPAGRSELLFNTCMRGTAGGELSLALGNPEDNAWLSFGDAYGGLFVTPWISVQSRGIWRDAKPIGKSLKEEKTLYTDYAVMQVGNPVLSRYRLTVGQSRLPFGIDQSEAPQFYQRLENRGFWHSPTHTAYITLDDLHSFRVDLGVASNMGDRQGEALEDAASIRAMYDVSSLEGTRIVASGYTSRQGERRFGAGMINHNGKDDYTEFEFVRRLTTPDGRAAPFEQLLRLNYTSAWHSNGRWVVQLDDEQLRFRRGIVDRDILLWNHAVVRFGIGYLKGEAGPRYQRWTLTTGLEAKL